MRISNIRIIQVSLLVTPTTLWKMCFQVRKVDSGSSKHPVSCELEVVVEMDVLVLILVVSRKRIFDGPQAEPTYQPAPEDRPGGFDWGEGRQMDQEDQMEAHD